MTSAFEAESKLNAAVEQLIPRGFRICSGRFGDDSRGCVFTAFAVVAGDRKLGESVLQVACRHLGIDDRLAWAAVFGYDGKGPTREVKANHADHVAWFEMGHRIAKRWDVHNGEKDRS